MAKSSGMQLLVKFRPKKLSNSSAPKLRRGGIAIGRCGGGAEASMGNINWELRPGGMLVQKREDGTSSSSTGSDDDEETIEIRISTGIQCYGMSIGATRTVGEVKEAVSVVTGMEPEEQRLLFRGKEREDGEHLHMVGVRDGNKVVVLQDPAAKASKLQSLSAQVALAATHCPASAAV